MVDILTPARQQHMPVLHTPSGLAGSLNDSAKDNGTEHVMDAVSRFYRWRPQYHLMAPHGWMNDPCALGYDRRTGLYHLGFQWNPKGYEWGNMSWGSATSTDMVHWKVADKPSIVPDGHVDAAGVFTGCLFPDTDEGYSERPLTAFYTSANILPIHHTLPYNYGSERLHIATSRNSGKTWMRDPTNPVLPGPPEHLSVTGWRDPFITPWSSLDALLDRPSGSLYGLIAGGLKDKTPTVFCYTIDEHDMCDWRFVGSLFELGLNHTTSKWTGEFGRNFEVASLVSFDTKVAGRFDFILTGVEGRDKTSLPSDRSDMVTDHNQMWLCCRAQASGSGIMAQYRFGGMLDWGCLYAATVFRDHKTQDYVSFGWILEGDLSADMTAQQKWSGCMSIPRVISLVEIKHVSETLRSSLSEITSIQAVPQRDGTSTVVTLGVSPHQNLAALRTSKIDADHLGRLKLLKGTPRCEFKAELAVDEQGQYGVDILHTQDGSGRTRIYFDSAKQEVIVDRSQSSRHIGVNRVADKAPHTLFRCRTADGQTELERLTLHVFFDVSALEVFVNGRTVITTRVYPESGSCFGAVPTSATRDVRLQMWKLKQSREHE